MVTIPAVTAGGGLTGAWLREKGSGCGGDENFAALQDLLAEPADFEGVFAAAGQDQPQPDFPVADFAVKELGEKPALAKFGGQVGQQARLGPGEEEDRVLHATVHRGPRRTSPAPAF